MINMKLVLLTSATLILAACGGSDGDSSKPTPKPDSSGISSASSYNQLVASAVKFENTYLANGTVADNATPAAQMPTSATAEYKGAAAIDVNGVGDSKTPDLLGVTKLTADFKKETVRGKIRHFKAAPGVTTVATGGSGSIDVDARFNGSNIKGTVDGNFKVNDVTHWVSGPTTGKFVGKDASGIYLSNEGSTNKGLDKPSVDYTLTTGAEKLN